MGMILIIVVVFVVAFVVISRIKLPQPQQEQIDPANLTANGIAQLVRNGNKLLAIKCYRIANHCDLKTAKDAIDRMG